VLNLSAVEKGDILCKVIKMVYVCDKCRFLFSRVSEQEQCPDCGKIAVRPATEEEKLEFENQLAQAKNDPL
jgi:rubrerythrin